MRLSSSPSLRSGAQAAAVGARTRSVRRGQQAQVQRPLRLARRLRPEVLACSIQVQRERRASLKLRPAVRRVRTVIESPPNQEGHQKLTLTGTSFACHMVPFGFHPVGGTDAG